MLIILQQIVKKIPNGAIYMSAYGSVMTILANSDCQLNPYIIYRLAFNIFE